MLNYVQCLFLLNPNKFLRPWIGPLIAGDQRGQPPVTRSSSDRVSSAITHACVIVAHLMLLVRTQAESRGTPEWPFTKLSTCTSPRYWPIRTASVSFRFVLERQPGCQSWRTLLWDDLCSRLPATRAEQGEGSAVQLQALPESEFSEQISRSKPTYELWSLSPSWVSQCEALRLLVCCQLGCLHQGGTPPSRPSPLHPFHPGQARKAFRRLHSKQTMLHTGIQETPCSVPHDLNEVMILLFPFPPTQGFSTQTQRFRWDEQCLLLPACWHQPCLLTTRGQPPVQLSQEMPRA